MTLDDIKKKITTLHLQAKSYAILASSLKCKYDLCCANCQKVGQQKCTKNVPDDFPNCFAPNTKWQKKI